MKRTVTLPRQIVEMLEAVVGQGNERVLVIAEGDQVPALELRRAHGSKTGSVDPQSELHIEPARHPGWERLRQFVKQHLATTTLEKKDRWRDEDDEELWRIVVGQVVVAGGSRPSEKMKASWSTLGLGYAALCQLGDAEARERLDVRFRDFGVRFVGDQPSIKSAHCVRNMRGLQRVGGPRQYFEHVAALPDETARIDHVIRTLSYMRKKGARDLLIGLGLIRNSIAIDTRVLGALEEAGVVSGQAGARDRRYQELEQAIIDNVAVPLGLEPARVDRAIYQARARARQPDADAR